MNPLPLRVFHPSSYARILRGGRGIQACLRVLLLLLRCCNNVVKTIVAALRTFYFAPAALKGPPSYSSLSSGNGHTLSSGDGHAQQHVKG